MLFGVISGNLSAAAVNCENGAVAVAQAVIEPTDVGDIAVL
ncbi:MAG: hypothetical protein CM15mP74_09390 [Halieaceae bacterium]|nr:MAG: hypothetical protein CM15mP74_09390 [Halieaceae bacterium]